MAHLTTVLLYRGVDSCLVIHSLETACSSSCLCSAQKGDMEALWFSSDFSPATASAFAYAYKSEQHESDSLGTRRRGRACEQGAVDKVPAPREVFGALHHHFLCLADAGLRLVGPEDAQQGACEQALLAAATSRDPEAERELCARAMAALYHSHAAAIGAHRPLAVGTP